MLNVDILNIHSLAEKTLATIDLSKNPERAQEVKEYTRLLITIDAEHNSISKQAAPFQRAIEMILQGYEIKEGGTPAPTQKKSYSQISADDQAKLTTLNNSVDDIFLVESSFIPTPVISEKYVMNGLLYRKLFPFIIPT